MGSQIAAKGTKLQLSIAGVYTDISQTVTFKGPGGKPEVYDGRHLGSGAAVPMKPTGYVAGGTVTGSAFMDPTDVSFKALTALIATPAVASWRVVWSNGASTPWPFSATLTSLEPNTDGKDGLKFDFELTLDGIVNYPT